MSEDFKLKVAERATMRSTLERCRSYLTRCEKAGKTTGGKYKAIAWLLEGLEDAARIIASQDMELQCVYRVLQQIKATADINVVTRGASLILRDALQQVFEEQNRAASDAILEARKQKIGKQP